MQTEKLAVNIPNPPDHFHAIETVPEEVQAKWKSSYERVYRRAISEGKDGTSAHAAALAEANRLIKVQEPADHDEASSIPDWQVMKRQEIPFSELPEHARRHLARTGRSGSAGTMYLRIYTTDGKEHFFPIPNRKQ